MGRGQAYFRKLPTEIVGVRGSFHVLWETRKGRKKARTTWYVSVPPKDETSQTICLPITCPPVPCIDRPPRASCLANQSAPVSTTGTLETCGDLVF